MHDSRFTTDSRKRYPIILELLPDLEKYLVENMLLSVFLDQHPQWCGPYPFLADLARIEESRYRLLTSPPDMPEIVHKRTVNPALELIPVKWLNLPEYIAHRSIVPKPGKNHILVMLKPGKNHVEIMGAGPAELLALKLVFEDIGTRRAASEGNISPGSIDNVLYRAQQQGLILVPPSLICRPRDFPTGEITESEFFVSPSFTLQWHITQACDLNCRHCYDRSHRKEMTLEQAQGVLDDLYDFCQLHHVFGQVSFSGGNPMLYNHFDRLYREAADRGFMTAVLGNPMPRGRIEKMLSIQQPEFYQVSLEGLKEHNDYIRGPGHFDRTIEFLGILGELGIYRMVMLTLTRDNMDQVIELGNRLRGFAELFTFNRLANVGRGTELAGVPPENFPRFLDTYMHATENNSCMGLKDNLFNLLRWQRGLPPTGGCAGHGCGAAFNFVALLQDGEVHACRKLPSLIGNIYHDSLNNIYHSHTARRYRNGSKTCTDCPVRPVCGACLAVVFGSNQSGINISDKPDPYCFRHTIEKS